VPLPHGVLAVRGAPAALDLLLGRLHLAGTALRELTPIVSPLEAAYLALTSGTAPASAEPEAVAS
jgi:ABC-2 type transport system ATP-binding protein